MKLRIIIKQTAYISIILIIQIIKNIYIHIYRNISIKEFTLSLWEHRLLRLCCVNLPEAIKINKYLILKKSIA